MRQQYTVREAAKILNVSPSSVRHACETKRLKAYRMPGSLDDYRILKKDLADYYTKYRTRGVR